MLIFIRSFIFYLGYWVSLLIIGIISLPLFLVPTKVAAPIVLLWNRFVLFWLRLCCGIDYEIIDERTNINNNLDSVVIVANHQSPWETLFLQLHFYPLITVLKRELLRIPFFGWGMRLLRPIAIDRSSPVQALKQIKKVGVQRLKESQNVLIFPEGTRQPVEHLGTFARSGADIAKAADVSVVIVAHDAGHYWVNKKFLKYPGTIRVFISNEISAADANTKELMQSVKQWVKEKLDG